MTQLHNANGAGRPTPESDEALAGGTAQGSKAKHGTGNGGDSASADVQRKYEATLIALAALAGVTVHAMRDDRGRPEWIATKWAMTRAFGSLDELAAWLDRVQGRAG